VIDEGPFSCSLAKNWPSAFPTSVLARDALGRRLRKFSKCSCEIAFHQRAADTLAILEVRRERLERHPNVAIADDAIMASVALTQSLRD
jgi:uncharacterized membrane protein